MTKAERWRAQWSGVTQAPRANGEAYPVETSAVVLLLIDILDELEKLRDELSRFP